MSSPFTVSFGEDSARLGFNSLRLSSQRFDSARFDSFIDYEDQYSVMDGGFVKYLDSPPPPAEGGGGGGPILPEEGFALGEWRRQNAIRLEEKERKEKEMLKVIIEEADKYKAELYKKWRIECENSKALSRDKEKKFLEDRDKFHAEASKSFWKAIAELIPRQVKKPTIVVIQGPKPGKPTDLSRMRQLLDTLKQAGDSSLIFQPHP